MSELQNLAISEEHVWLNQLEASLARKVYFEYPEHRDVLIGSLIVGQSILLDGDASVGKTTMAEEFAKITGQNIERVQASPDTMPSDITGSLFWDQAQGRYVFHKGPVFVDGILLVDEINRMSQRSSAGLHQAMAEGRVTPVGSKQTYSLPKTNVIIGTRNPHKSYREGTTEMSLALTDRFGVSIGLPSPSINGILSIEDLNRRERKVLEGGPEKIAKIGNKVSTIIATDQTRRISSELIVALRENPAVDQEESILAGPRAHFAVMALARFIAFRDNREEVQLSDIKKVFPYALRHRVVMKKDDIDSEEFIRDVINR